MDNKKTSKFITLMLFVVAILWGIGFMATQIAIDNNYSEYFILSARFLIASLIFGIVFYKDIKNIKKSQLLGGILCGTALFGGFLFQTIGLKYTTPANSAFITATYIIFIPFLSWGIMKKRPSLKSFVSAILCFFGIWLLSSSGEKIKFGIGDILTLICSVCFAVHMVLLDILHQKKNQIQVF